MSTVLTHKGMLYEAYLKEKKITPLSIRSDTVSNTNTLEVYHL